MPEPVPTLSLGDVKKLEFQEDNYSIGAGLMTPQSLMVIGGQPKTYKSFLVGSMAVDLVLSRPLWGVFRKGKHEEKLWAFPITKPHKVLIVEQELGLEELKNRYSALDNSLTGQDLDTVCKNLFFHSCDFEIDLKNDATIKAVDRAIEEVKPDVIVFDPLKDCNSADENSSQQMGVVMKNLSRIRRSYNLSVVLIHHMTKPQRDVEAGPEHLRGSSVLFASGDTFLTVKSNQKKYQNQVEIEFKLRRGKPITPIKVVVDCDRFECRFNGWVRGRPEAGEL
jgi:RecA-family ATPase